MNKEILNNNHRYWKALCYRLSEGIRTQGCNCTPFIAERILVSLPGIDVEATLNYFKEMGGYCDCEILNSIYGIDDKAY